MHSLIALSFLCWSAALTQGAAITARQDRPPACTSDACGNAFTLAPGMKRSQEASSFCSAYMTATAPDSTITTTATTTVPGNVVTVTASPAVTTTVTSYACPVPLKKRGEATTPTWAASVCTATGTVRAEARLSSACSCMGITARTADAVTTTTTATETGPVSTSTVTPTITTTIINPWNPKPTNLIQNGGFEDQLSHWSYSLSDTWAHLQFATPGRASNQSAQIDLQSPGGIHGSYYGNGVTLVQDIAPIHGDYDYAFSVDYQFLTYRNDIWSCHAYLNASSTNIGETTFNAGSGDDGWSTVVFSRQASTQNPIRLDGPLKLSVACYYDLNQPAGTTMATIQLDNVVWKPVAGCHPM